MPIYEYANSKTGQIEEHFRTIARRDCVEPHLKRIMVPQRVGFANAAHLREPGAAADVPKAFREYELSGADVHKIERETGFKRESIRRIWNFVILALAMVTLSANASDLTAGYIFTPTDRVTATKLNSLVGGADINTTFATDKSAAQPLASDTMIFYQSSSGAWRKTTFDQLLLSNTNIITGQVESDSPSTNDYFLFFDASAGSLAKVPLDGILTNLFLIAQRQEFTNGPLPELSHILIESNNVLYRVSWSNFFQYSWRDELFSTNVAAVNPLTNPPIASLHTSPTNADMFRIWDAKNQTNKFTTIAGFMTNPPVVPEGALTNTDDILIFSRATNAFSSSASTGVVAQVALTNLAHFVVQKYVSAGFPVPNSATGTTNLHGLPGTPQIFKAALVCTNAELGFMVGDESDFEYSSGNANIGCNSTNIWISSPGIAVWSVLRRDTAAAATITKVNWNVKLEAFYFP